MNLFTMSFFPFFPRCAMQTEREFPRRINPMSYPLPPRVIPYNPLLQLLPPPPAPQELLQLIVPRGRNFTTRTAGLVHSVHLSTRNLQVSFFLFQNVVLYFHGFHYPSSTLSIESNFCLPL